VSTVGRKGPHAGLYNPTSPKTWQFNHLEDHAAHSTALSATLPHSPHTLAALFLKANAHRTRLVGPSLEASDLDNVERASPLVPAVLLEDKDSVALEEPREKPEEI
jgi:hypothetical protein